MNVLAIGAHGDDLEAFCGGTLALYARTGHKVFMCVVTDGRGNPLGNPNEIAEMRKQEAHASAAVIGAELLWLGVPDGGMETNEETRHLFVEAIRSTEADVIITHPGEDYHPDHVKTNQMVLEAAQVARIANYKSSLTPNRKTVPVGFMDSENGVDFIPQDYVDISEVWMVKEEMLLKHRSQHMPRTGYDANYVLPPADQLPIIRAARIMSEFRGLSCNTRYAEGFRWWHSAHRIVPKRLLP